MCADAQALEPSARPSARALADTVQRYLDGDRDIEVRRSHARAAIADAREKLATNQRGPAIHAAGRGLAFDPSSLEAAELVTQVMLEPPTAPLRSCAPSLRRPLLIVNAVLVGLIARVCSPLLVAPVAASVVVASLLLFPALGRRWVVVLVCVLGAWLVEVALEASGILDRSWHMDHGTLVITPTALPIDGPYTVVLIVLDAMMVIVGGAHVARLALLNHKYEREIMSQRWHYQQLIPKLATR